MLVIPPRAEMRAHPIETERLVLLPVDPGDGQELWGAVSGSRATLQPWLPWVQYHTDPNASRRFAEACAADWDQGRALRFIIREKGGHAVAGIVGLEACVHLHRSCELGYWLRQEVTGKGYMTEAARGCMEFAFTRMGVHRIRVAAATTNHASMKVIGRLHFQFEGIARQAEWCDGRWLDHAIYGLLSTDPR